MKTQQRTAAVRMIAEEVELFRAYLAERPDVHTAHEQAYGEQWYRINAAAWVLACEVEHLTDPNHGTTTARLAGIKAVNEAFLEARKQIREMFTTWLNNR